MRFSKEAVRSRWTGSSIELGAKLSTGEKADILREEEPALTERMRV